MSEENKFIRLFGNQIPILGILPVSEDKTGEELFAEYEQYRLSGIDGVILSPMNGDDGFHSLFAACEFFHYKKLSLPLGLKHPDKLFSYKIATNYHLPFILLDEAVHLKEEDAELFDHAKLRETYENLVVIAGIEQEEALEDLPALLKKGKDRADALLYLNHQEQATTESELYDLYQRLGTYNATRTPLVTFPIPLRMQGQLLYPNLGGIIGDETFRKGNTLEGTLDQEKIDRFMERVIDYRISRHSMLEALGK